jgi:hypothetical protein
MPETMNLGFCWAEVATEEELLEFANKVRKAGGADVIEALLPSLKGAQSKCLIANALNFSCRVHGYDRWSRWEDGSKEYRWCMELPENMDVERAEKIASEVGLEYDEEYHCFPLPRHIGNAAYAFDLGRAFHDYAIPSLVHP